MLNHIVNTELYIQNCKLLWVVGGIVQNLPRSELFHQLWKSNIRVVFHETADNLPANPPSGTAW